VDLNPLHQVAAFGGSLVEGLANGGDKSI